jgi:hypothetical protein
MKAFTLVLLAPLALALPVFEKRFPHMNTTVDDTDGSISYATSGAPWYHNGGFTGAYYGTLS